MKLDSQIAFITERRLLAFVFSLLLIFALSAGASRLLVEDVDFRNHFSQDDPRLTALEQFEDTYAISDTVLVVVAPERGNIFTRDALLVVESLTDQLWKTPYATRIDSITNFSHSEGIEDDLIVEPLVSDAGSLSDSDLARIEQIALGTQEIAGRLVSRDGLVAGLAVSFAMPDDSRQQVKLEVVDVLNARIDEFREKHSNFQFHLVGELLLNRAISDALVEDFSILGPISLGTMLLVTIIVLRSIWGTIAIILMVMTVVLSSLGFTGWMGMKFYGESGAGVFVLMAITVAHCVHVIEAVLSGLRLDLERKQAISQSLQQNVWPVFLTSVTTAIGFLSLNFSDMPPFRVMGNMVAFGSLFAFCLSVTFLPFILSIMPLRARSERRGKTDLIDRLGQFVVSRHLFLIVSFGAVVIVLLAGIARIELDENPLKLLDDSYEYRRSTDWVTDNFSGLEPFEYSLNSGREGGINDVGYLNQVDSFANWYRAQPEVAHVFAVTDIIKRLNRSLNGDDQDYYRIPDNSNLAAQYLLLYEFSLPVGLDLNNLIDVERAATRLTAVLDDLSANEKIALDQRARAWLQSNAPDLETSATGVAIVGAHSINRNIVFMLIGTITAMGIVSFLLFFVFKSLRFGLISLIPNFFPAAMAMGLWGYLIGEIGVSAAVVTAIAFGIIVDDTIHFMTKYLAGRTMGFTPSESIQSAFNTVGKALVATTVIFGLGFIVFGASAMANNQALGLLMGITVVVALLADFLFLPPLLIVLDRRKPNQETKQSTG